MNPYTAAATARSRVQVTGRVPRAFTPTFVGWGAFDHQRPAAEQGLVDVPVGALATVVDTESHGSFPYTRLVLDVDGVGRTNGVDPASVAFL